MNVPSGEWRTNQRRFYGGIELHARTFSLCLDVAGTSILDAASAVVLAAAGAAALHAGVCFPHFRCVRSKGAEHQELNFPDAARVRRALNRSDATKTDQENLSPSAVFLLTDRGHIWVRRSAAPAPPRERWRFAAYFAIAVFTFRIPCRCQLAKA
jgi:hypothetical protein